MPFKPVAVENINIETECNVCGFPSEDDRWCKACEAIYQAKDTNYYDLGGSDGKEQITSSSSRS